MTDIILTMLGFFFIGGGIITAFIVYAEYKKHRPVKAAACADYYKVDEETRMTAQEDSFLRTHTSRIKVSDSSSKARRR